MTSIVSRLARTLSQGADGSSHRRSTSATDGSTVSPRPYGQARLSTSPSFNDFSLNVQEDVEEEYRSSVFAASSRKLDPVGVLQPQAAEYRGTTASIRAAEDPPKVTTTPRATRTKSVKIMGMDAYDYHDLLRSSSL